MVKKISFYLRSSAWCRAIAGLEPTFSYDWQSSAQSIVLPLLPIKDFKIRVSVHYHVKDSSFLRHIYVVKAHLA